MQHVSSADLLALDEDHHPFVAWSKALPGKERAEAAFFVVELFIFNVSLNICTFREALFSSLGKSFFEEAHLTSFLQDGPMLAKIDELETRWKRAAKDVWMCHCRGGFVTL